MIPNDRQTGPAEEGEARLASPSSQSSVQQSIPDEVRALVGTWRALRDEAKRAGNPSAESRGQTLIDCADELFDAIQAFLAGSTVSGQGEG